MKGNHKLFVKINVEECDILVKRSGVLHALKSCYNKNHQGNTRGGGEGKSPEIKEKHLFLADVSLCLLFCKTIARGFNCGGYACEGHRSTDVTAEACAPEEPAQASFANRQWRV